jgi:hypothetical protein
VLFRSSPVITVCCSGLYFPVVREESKRGETAAILLPNKKLYWFSCKYGTVPDSKVSAASNWKIQCGFHFKLKLYNLGFFRQTKDDLLQLDEL